MNSNSKLDIIAEITAKTIVSVQEVYRDASSGGRKEQTGQTGNDDTVPFFTYGTPFSSIVQFTRDVEEFTRHIDAQTRKRRRRQDG